VNCFRVDHTCDPQERIRDIIRDAKWSQPCGFKHTLGARRGLSGPNAHVSALRRVSGTHTIESGLSPLAMLGAPGERRAGSPAAPFAHDRGGWPGLLPDRGLQQPDRSIPCALRCLTIPVDKYTNGIVPIIIKSPGQSHVRSNP